MVGRRSTPAAFAAGEAALTTGGSLSATALVPVWKLYVRPATFGGVARSATASTTWMSLSAGRSAGGIALHRKSAGRGRRRVAALYSVDRDGNRRRVHTRLVVHGHEEDAGVERNVGRSRRGRTLGDRRRRGVGATRHQGHFVRIARSSIRARYRRAPRSSSSPAEGRNAPRWPRCRRRANRCKRPARGAGCRSTRDSR